MRVEIIADENINFQIIKKLRENDCLVVSVLESYSGITDKEVIELANVNHAILLTEDKDFGELVFSYKLSITSVIFLRYEVLEIESIIEKLLFLLNEKELSYFQNKFLTLTPNKIRIRDL